MLPSLSRRQLLQAASLGLLGTSASGLSGLLPLFADDAPQETIRKSSTGNAGKKRRQVVLLWMAGGPSQMDTFDLKPGHANGGTFKETATNVPGLKYSEHLPKLAAHADRLAIVRGLSTKEGDHGRGTYLMRTGQRPQGPIQYPSVGATFSKGLTEDFTSTASSDAPAQVAISPYRAFNPAAFGPGFLGPKFAPLTVGAVDAVAAAPAEETGYAQLKVDDLALPAGLSPERAAARLAFWKKQQQRFMKEHPVAAPLAQDTVYQRALRLMNSSAAEAFQLDQEPAAIREAYGKGRFGQGCLMARRLLERGVSFVEVSLGSTPANPAGWDTHQNNFAEVQKLSAELDAGWSMLMQELNERGLLESTTILWMGEFGRTPKINPQGGRDHFPGAWTCVFAGGGIKGGQAFGKTSDDGMTVEENKVETGDVLATLATACGLNPAGENISPEGRPIKRAEGKAIGEIVAV